MYKKDAAQILLLTTFLFQDNMVFLSGEENVCYGIKAAEKPISLTLVQSVIMILKFQFSNYTQ